MARGKFDPIRYTSIVQSESNTDDILVRSHAGWMDDESIKAYLGGFEIGPLEGISVLFSRVEMWADIGEVEGGAVKASYKNGRWYLKKVKKVVPAWKL